MILIKPISVTDAMVISTNVTEDEHTVWNAATSYSVGDKVIRTETHRSYENLIAGIDSTPPEDGTGGASPRWLDIAPTNRWALFDSVIGTKTSKGSSINYEISPSGQLFGVAFLELVGDTLDVSVIDGAGGTTVYTKSISLDATVIASFNDYFFAEKVQRDIVVLTDLPGSYLNARLKFTLTGSGTVEMGACKFGPVNVLGFTTYGVNLRREDFSKKETDAFGNTVIKKRPTRKLLSGNIVSEIELFPRLDQLMRDMQSIAGVYIASDDEQYQTLVVYGFVSDFLVTVAFSKSLHSHIEIEGLI